VQSGFGCWLAGSGKLTGSQHGLVDVVTQVAEASAVPPMQCESLPQVLGSLVREGCLGSPACKSGIGQRDADSWPQWLWFACMPL